MMSVVTCHWAAHKVQCIRIRLTTVLWWANM